MTLADRDDRRATSTIRVENRRLKKTDSLKENEDTTKQGRSLTSRSTKYPSTLTSPPASANGQSSSVVTKPQAPREEQEPAYPPYNYADHIPKPKVLYIRDEGRANEMVYSLNGSVHARSSNYHIRFKVITAPLALTSSGLFL